MKDLEKALQIEQEYLEYRIHGEEPFSLLIEIQKCGFQNLEDFQKAKTIYNVKQLNFSIQETTSGNFAGTVLQLVMSGKPGFVFAPTTEVCVAHGTEAYNEKYCEEHNIPVHGYQAFGGNIVGAPGDLSVGINVTVPDVDPMWILDRIVEKMNRYGQDVTIDGNDILYNNKKVAGCAFYRTELGCSFIVHFSFSDRIELIRNICLPATIHKDIGYIDFMTAEQLKEEILEWQL